MKRRQFLKMASSSSVALGLAGYMPASGAKTSPTLRSFHFDWITDPHSITGSDQTNAGNFEKFVLPSLANDNDGMGDFLVSTGDLDTFALTNSAIQRKLVAPAKNLGKEYTWYPVQGNHDSTNTSTASWARNDGGANLSAQWNWNKNNLKNMNWGPDAKGHDVGYGPNSEGIKYSLFSWDWENCHFINMNLYADDPTRAFVYNYQMDWLKADLESAKGQEHVFVLGHQPIGEIGGGEFMYTQMAAPTGAFWSLLTQYPNVRAYLYGHHHQYTVEKVSGIYRIQGGQGRGTSQGTNQYTRVYIDGGNVKWTCYSGAGAVVGTGTMVTGTPAVSAKNRNILGRTSRDLRVVRLNSGVEVNVSLPGVHQFEIIDARGVVRKSSIKKRGHRYFIPAGSLSHGTYVLRVSGASGILSEVLNIF